MWGVLQPCFPSVAAVAAAPTATPFFTVVAKLIDSSQTHASAHAGSKAETAGHGESCWLHDARHRCRTPLTPCPCPLVSPPFPHSVRYLSLPHTPPLLHHPSFSSSLALLLLLSPLSLPLTPQLKLRSTLHHSIPAHNRRSFPSSAFFPLSHARSPAARPLDARRPDCAGRPRVS